MLCKEDRDEINGSSVYRDYIMEQTLDVVTYFYPDQLLTLTVDWPDIMDIMNCDEETAKETLLEIREAIRNQNDQPLSMWDFCDCLDIDDMLMQVFLASLSNFHPSPPVHRIQADIACTRLRTVDEVSKELQQGILPSDEVYQLRLQLWDELNPIGELMRKRIGFYRCIIRAYEIALIYGCHIDTAREMLQSTLKEAGIPKQRHVSIKKFCEINHMDEEDLRKSLARIHGDEEEE